MSSQQLHAFASVSPRLQMDESIEFTTRSLQAFGATHKHWALAWSGGKDSTTILTVTLWLLATGKVAAPESLTVLFADTRMEMVPLLEAAADIMDNLRERGVDVRTVVAPVAERFYVQMFGRGLPPPGAGFRWCTPMLKLKPMQAELARLVGEKGEKVLMITGVRQGESAVRDARIVMSCGKNGAECGQGWYQETLPSQLCDTLAPLLPWRVCHVWEWLRRRAPQPEYGDWSTKLLAEAYGGDEAEEANTRTGCMGCPVASQDRALEALVARPAWAYQRPLLRLREVFEHLRTHLPFRLRQPGGEKNAAGKLVANQQRLGPLTMEGRRWGMAQVLAIQAEVNEAAARLGRPRVDLLNEEEVAAIEALQAANAWPDKWTGEEPTADVPLPVAFANGTVQPLLDFMTSARS